MPCESGELCFNYLISQASFLCIDWGQPVLQVGDNSGGPVVHNPFTAKTPWLSTPRNPGTTPPERAAARAITPGTHRCSCMGATMNGTDVASTAGYMPRFAQ